MSLQAGLPYSAPDRRLRLRHKVHSPAYVTKDSDSSFILPHLNEIVDIAEDGICFQHSAPLEPRENLELCLDLSETGVHIEAVGEVIWSDESGRTGIRFQEISQEALHRLREWLFVNSIIACANYPDPVIPARTDDSSAELIEYADPLLPDHTSSLAAVSAIDREVAALSLEIDAALQLICDRTMALTRATGTAVALSGGETLICRASAGTDAPPIGAMLQIGSGFSGECVRTGETLSCEDSETDPRVDQRSCRALGVRSMIAVPVRAQGSVVGLLEVFSPQANAFNGADKEILQRLSEIVSQAIRRSAMPDTEDPGAASSDDVGAQSLKDESSSPSRSTRLLLALAAAAVASLLALIVIPRVRSKMDTPSTSQSAAPATLATSTIPKTAGLENLEGIKRLAEQGNPTAQFALGARYATGEEVKQDYREAARWFLLAADHGDVKAQSVLAAYYWDGTGVPKDLSKAYFWAILARANGDEPGKTRAAELATRISYNERNLIQQQADDWLRQHGFSALK